MRKLTKVCLWFYLMCRAERIKGTHRGGEFCWNHGPVVRPVGHAIFSISHIRHMSNRVVRERKEGTERSAEGECVGV